MQTLPCLVAQQPVLAQPGLQRLAEAAQKTGQFAAVIAVRMFQIEFAERPQRAQRRPQGTDAIGVRQILKAIRARVQAAREHQPGIQQRHHAALLAVPEHIALVLVRARVTGHAHIGGTLGELGSQIGFEARPAQGQKVSIERQLLVSS